MVNGKPTVSMLSQTTNEQHALTLDPACPDRTRIEGILIGYGDRTGAQRFLRHALSASHICRCPRCSTYAGLLELQEGGVPCRE